MTPSQTLTQTKILQTFWRIVDTQLYAVDQVPYLGFEESEGLRIPDEYLDKQEFMVMRTCHGIGDWGIISAMPRLLKEKYSNCKVYVPSPKLLKKLFHAYEQNWNVWNNPFDNVKTIFDNNPYVDGYKDEMSGEVFHDHYRVYNKDVTDIPLLEQMLKFWQFEPNELSDSRPELYFSEEEKRIGNKIIEQYTDSDFGIILISNRYKFTDDNLMIDVLKQNDIPYFYYSPAPLNQTAFNFVNKALDLRYMNMRMQLYIRSKARLNIGNQSGALQLVVRDSKIYDMKRQFPIAGNYVKGEIYLEDDFKRNLLIDVVDKLESKTTTSLKFKADIIDFFRDGYKDKTLVEIGSSLGHGTKVLCKLFKKVVAVDISHDKHNYAREYLKGIENVEFVLMDVYNTMWNFEDKDSVVFIDCVHAYDTLKSDIDNSINTFNKPIIIFDDYGLFPELKKLIDEYVKLGKLQILKRIGEYKGKFYPKTENKILKDREGVICKVL
jgi:hypothetical protein